MLEPLSHTALAKFVIVERPAYIADNALRSRVAALEAEVAALGVDPNPVYALYAAIRWIFQAGDIDPNGVPLSLGFKQGWHLQDFDFQDPAVTAPFAAEPIEWGSVPGLIVAPITNRTEALAAIDAITAQGEGAPGTTESHFQGFLGLLDSFEARQVTVTAMPRTPYTSTQPPPEDAKATPIVNAYTVLWARLFNAIYELLLLDLAWSYSRPRQGMARAPMIDVCIDSMRLLVQGTSAYLIKRPMDAAPDVNAGPPYGLSEEDVPTTVQDFAQRYHTILATRDSLIAAIQAAEDFGSDLAGQLILGHIAEIDPRRTPHLPPGV